MTDSIPHKLRQFIRQENLALDNLDQSALIANFVEQMHLGLNAPSKEKASLAMLASHLHVPEQIPLNSPVITIDAGGSFLKVALLEFSKDAQENICAKLSQQNTFDMPGKSHSQNKTDFFENFYQCIKPLLKKSENIGLCFSYPCQISANKDGKLLRWTKEIQAPEVEGLWIGENLNKTLAQHRHTPKNIVLLNDTVATLLAGAIQTNSKDINFDAHIGLILGTGTNSAYWSAHQPQLSIINIESGAFDGYKNTSLDNILDALCSDQGHYLFEKKIAGRYLGNLCLQLLKKAAQANFFSVACTHAIMKHSALETAALNSLLNRQSNMFDANDQDHEIIIFLIETIIKRAALLSAIQLCAAAIKSDGGKKQGNAVAITIDGSTYYQLQNYQQRITEQLSLLMKQHAIRYQLLAVNDAPLVGAALAALANP